MKKFSLSLLPVVMLLFSLNVKAQTQNNGKQTVKIKTSAVCDMCKTTLEKAMAYEKGVKSSSLDVDSKILTIVFDGKKTNTDNLRKAVNEAGYDADDKPAQPRAYNKLDDCCKKEAGDH